VYLRPSDNSTVATKSPVKRTDFRRSEFFNGLIGSLLYPQPTSSLWEALRGFPEGFRFGGETWTLASSSASRGARSDSVTSGQRPHGACSSNPAAGSVVFYRSELGYTRYQVRRSMPILSAGVVIVVGTAYTPSGRPQWSRYVREILPSVSSSPRTRSAAGSKRSVRPNSVARFPRWHRAVVR
jgi:hypothetical protein